MILIIPTITISIELPGGRNMENDINIECIKGNEKSYEKLITAYEGKIYNMCCYMLKNKEDAMDASQEVCIKIFKYIKKFKGDSKLSTWIYRITYNTCIDFIKKSRNDVSIDDVIALDSHKDSSVENIIESREMKLEIKRCIKKLSEDFKAIIILRDIEGLTYNEISEILNIEVGTVKSRLNRAREALRNELIKSGVVRR